MVLLIPLNGVVASKQRALQVEKLWRLVYNSVFCYYFVLGSTNEV